MRFLISTALFLAMIGWSNGSFSTAQSHLTEPQRQPPVTTPQQAQVTASAMSPGQISKSPDPSATRSGHHQSPGGAQPAKQAASGKRQDPLKQKLDPPSKKGKRQTGRRSQRPTGPMVTTLGSLGVVLALFFLLMWFVRRSTPQSALSLPEEAVEVLGRSPLSNKQQLQLVRLGNKLLLIAVSHSGAEPLGEISDPDEVERLTALCQQNKPGSISATFRQMLSQTGRQRAPRGFLGALEAQENQ